MKFSLASVHSQSLFGGGWERVVEEEGEPGTREFEENQVKAVP